MMLDIDEKMKNIVNPPMIPLYKSRSAPSLSSLNLEECQTKPTSLSTTRSTNPYQLFQICSERCHTLIVHVIQGFSITRGKIKDWLYRPDPYVRVSVPDSPNPAQQTKHVVSSASPTWDQHLIFYVDPYRDRLLEFVLVDLNRTLNEEIGRQVVETALLLMDEESSIICFRNGSKIQVKVTLERNYNFDMRFDLSLCQEEQEFLQKREKVIEEGLRNFLMVSCSVSPSLLSEQPPVSSIVSLGSCSPVPPITTAHPSLPMPLPCHLEAHSLTLSNHSETLFSNLPVSKPSLTFSTVPELSLPLTTISDSSMPIYTHSEAFLPLNAITESSLPTFKVSVPSLAPFKHPEPSLSITQLPEASPISSSSIFLPNPTTNINQTISNGCYCFSGSSSETTSSFPASTKNNDKNLPPCLNCDKDNLPNIETIPSYHKESQSKSESTTPTKKLPTIALLSSGGGFRAMIAYSGATKALQSCGIIDCVLYTAALSGSSWYLSTLYSHPAFPKPEATNLIIPELRSCVEKHWQVHLSPPWSSRYLKKIIKKSITGQPVSFTDFFGYLVGEQLLKRRMKSKLSDQKEKISNGEAPLPMYTCVHVKKNVSAKVFQEWYEFTPYEVCIPKYGTSIPSPLFGSKYYMGKALVIHKELPLHFLIGVWGSAFTILAKRLVREKNVGGRGEIVRMVNDNEEDNIQEEEGSVSYERKYSIIQDINDALSSKSYGNFDNNDDLDDQISESNSNNGEEASEKPLDILIGNEEDGLQNSFENDDDTFYYSPPSEICKSPPIDDFSEMTSDLFGPSPPAVCGRYSCNPCSPPDLFQHSPQSLPHMLDESPQSSRYIYDDSLKSPNDLIDPSPKSTISPNAVNDEPPESQNNIYDGLSRYNDDIYAESPRSQNDIFSMSPSDRSDDGAMAMEKPDELKRKTSFRKKLSNFSFSIKRKSNGEDSQDRNHLSPNVHILEKVSPTPSERVDELEREQSRVERVLEKSLCSHPIDTRAGRAGLILNPLRGLTTNGTFPEDPGHQSPIKPTDNDMFKGYNEAMKTENKRIYLVDSGLSFNLPFPVLLRPQRKIQLYITFDFSSRTSDSTPPFRELLLSEKWARLHKLPFPNIREQVRYFIDKPVQECYVFKNTQDISCPVIILFPLVNKNFRTHSAPGVPRDADDQFGNFDIFDNTNDYAIWRFVYPNITFDRLSQMMEFNVLNNIHVVREEIKELMEKVNN